MSLSRQQRTRVRLLDGLRKVDARAVAGHGERRHIKDPTHWTNGEERDSSTRTGLRTGYVHRDRPDAVAFQIEDFLSVLSPHRILAGGRDLLSQAGPREFLHVDAAVLSGHLIDDPPGARVMAGTDYRACPPRTRAGWLAEDIRHDGMVRKGRLALDRIFRSRRNLIIPRDRDPSESQDHAGPRCESLRSAAFAIIG
jgi:hypothetical protein